MTHNYMNALIAAEAAVVHHGMRDVVVYRAVNAGVDVFALRLEDAVDAALRLAATYGTTGIARVLRQVGGESEPWVTVYKIDVTIKRIDSVD